MRSLFHIPSQHDVFMHVIFDVVNINLVISSIELHVLYTVLYSLFEALIDYLSPVSVIDYAVRGGRKHD